MHTPVTHAGLRMYDHLPAREAVMEAWQRPGARPDWHRRARWQVYLVMRQLAERLDRDDAAGAVAAWGAAGVRDDQWRQPVRVAMPLLARALDRASGAR